VAEELRKKFRRYIAQATPMSDQLVGLIEKLFRDRTEQIRLSKPGGVAPETSEVFLPMEDLVRHLERYDFDWDDAQNFMRTERFRQSFQTIDEKLYRIV